MSSTVQSGLPVRINPQIPGKLTIVAEGALGSPRLSGNGQVEVWDQVMPIGESVMRWKDGKTENLSNDAHDSIFPVPSHNGNEVVYTQFNSLKPDDPNGRWEVHEWKNGTNSTVAKSGGNLFDVALSGDGRTVAWDNDGNGRMQTWNIQKQTAGGPVVDVTTGQGSSSDPRLDYTGKHLIFTNASTGTAQIWVAEGDRQPHAIAPSKGFQSGASIAPIGGQVIFSDDASGLGQVTQAKDGHATTPVPAAHQDEWQAAQSVFGNHIVWSNIDRTKSDPPMELFIKDGKGAAVQLTDSSGGLNAYPSMSDDGRVISWLWVDPGNPHHARVYRFERDCI